VNALPLVSPRAPSSNRRAFLARTAVGAAASFPLIAAGRRATALPGDRDLRIAAIGVGGSRGVCNQGGYIARSAAQHGRLIAVCDIDSLHAAEFNGDFGGKLVEYVDYRELILKERPDVVTIGTPDHWHVPIAVAALQSGCHVYCEKPLTLTVDEGFRLREAVRSSGKVLQVGTHQRSEFDRRFLKAVALVQSGRLGGRLRATVSIESSETGGPFATARPPADLDWDLWLGPSPAAEYSPERRRGFRFFYEYSGGNMTDWGAHHIDVAQWALGYDKSGPRRVRGTADFTSLVPKNFDWRRYLDGQATLPNGYNTATKFDVTLEYENGSTLRVVDHFARSDGTKFDNGILFEGEVGKIFVNRERLSGKPVEDLTEADQRELEDRMRDLYKGKTPASTSGHMSNFFECILKGGEPVSDFESQHRSVTSCHLANVALMLGREVRWNPDAERFVDDPEAESFLTRPRRAGYELS
jgi:predicted dehydrogenase